MKSPWAKANEIAEKFENKAVKIVAFWGALTGLVALVPTIFGLIYWLYNFGIHLYNLDKYVTEITAAQEYNYFMINQLTRMVEAEADGKQSFGIPVRMTNAPDGAFSGDLWYFTYIRVNDNWHPVIYGAFPNMTRKQVGILDIHGEYGIAGKEPHPDKEEIEKLHPHTHE
jgi:hypothetical protein